MRDGNAEIYLVGSEGGTVNNLTQDVASDVGPDWSNDGSRICFSSDRTGANEIWVMNFNGSSPVSLTSGLDASGPSWRP
jgi:TolB protein